MWRGRAVRGGGGGAGRTDNAGRGRAGGRAALGALPFLSSRLLLAPLSFSSSPLPPPRFEGRGIHFNGPRRPLFGLRRRAGGRGAPGSLRRLVWSGPGELRQPPRHLSVFPPRLPPLGAARRAGPLLLIDLNPRGCPRIKGRESGKQRLALPFPVGRGGAGGSLLPELGLRRADRWSCPVRAAVSSRGLCAHSRRPPGSRARPALCSHFQVYLCPFSFLSPSEKGKPNKRVSLFLFRACKVEGI